jgi:hypothetical protein
MPRFLLFPPLFAVWFLSAWFGFMVVSWARIYAAFYFFPPTDTYFIINRISPSLFTPAIAIGAVVGCAFAALDFALHRNSRTPKQTLVLLLRNGIRSSILAVVLILLCQGALLAVAAQESHQRYHAYSPEMTWLNLTAYAQIGVIVASALWTMGKTLLKPPLT